MTMKIVQQFKNATAIIKQIKANEWKFTGNYEYVFSDKFICYTAERNGLKLWLASGPFECHIRNKPWELGIFGLLVWYGGARGKKKQLEREKRRQPTDLTK